MALHDKTICSNLPSTGMAVLTSGGYLPHLHIPSSEEFSNPRHTTDQKHHATDLFMNNYDLFFGEKERQNTNFRITMILRTNNVQKLLCIIIILCNLIKYGDQSNHRNLNLVITKLVINKTTKLQV